ncbi:hypothetical protein [Streptomyces sp. NBC_00887]|uniref:hypothetical protein n=1 Tax=Streptomyces sp. NBC_00887 TaxID=2975859 RepID=UPI00386CC9CC|nr:hypothetical protein OG844_12565 [Streptomyces sp. NBC_00887]
MPVLPRLPEHRLHLVRHHRLTDGDDRSGAGKEEAERMAVRVAEDPHVLLGLVLLQRRSQGASSLGLRLQVVDL